MNMLQFLNTIRAFKPVLWFYCDAAVCLSACVTLNNIYSRRIQPINFIFDRSLSPDPGKNTYTLR